MTFVQKIQKSLRMIAVCALIPPAGGTVVVSWNANSESDLAGYKVYFGNAPGTYHTTRDAGLSTELAINDLVENVPYYFAVTAYDTANNESSFSDEVFFILNNETTPGDDTLKINLSSYNFPNPFRPGEQVTNIRYLLDAPSEVSIRVYDVTNNLVRTLLENGTKSAGEHVEDFWDGKDESGNTVANGVYFCEIKSATFTHYIKIAVAN